MAGISGSRRWPRGGPPPVLRRRWTTALRLRRPIADARRADGERSGALGAPAFRGERIVKPVIVILALAMAPVAASAQTSAARTLDIYFIDVEGGQATLLVTPAGQTLLVDAGFAGTGTFDYRPGDAARARYPQRILAVAKLAGVSRIDYLLATHFHGDHVGGVPELAQLMPIGTFIDHGGGDE